MNAPNLYFYSSIIMLFMFVGFGFVTGKKLNFIKLIKNPCSKLVFGKNGKYKVQNPVLSAFKM